MEFFTKKTNSAHSFADAADVEFSFTLGKSSLPEIAGKDFFVNADGTIGKTVFGNISTGTFQTVTMQGLEQFGDFLDGLQPNEFIVTGLADACRDAAIVPIALKNHPVPGGIARTLENFLPAAGHHLGYFDLDRAKGIVAPPVQETLATLYTIMPILKGVAFLGRGSASAGIYLDGEPEPMERTGGERLYFLFDSGLEIEKFISIFKTQAWCKGYGTVEIDKAGRRHPGIKLDEHTKVDMSVFSPERIDFCGPNRIGPGLKRKKWPNSHKPGGVLSLLGINTSELEETTAAKNQQVAMDALATDAKAVAKQWRAAHGKDLKAAKMPDKLVDSILKTLENQDTILEEGGGLTKTGYPKIVFTVGHKLHFVNGDVVDVIDVLRSPESFDGQHCLDPLEPSKGDKAIFYANRNLLFSFASGGYVVELKKIDIIFDHDQQLKVMKLLDAILSSGDRPDLFLHGPSLVQPTQAGALKDVQKELLPVLIGRFVNFKALKQSRDGSSSLASYSPNAAFWVAFLSRGDIGLPTIKGIRTGPLFNEGRIVCRRGYDAATGLYLADDYLLDEQKIGQATRAEAEKALDKLLDAMRHFPFVGNKHKAAAVAMMLAVVQRPLLGCVPFFMVAANAPATGKTQLVSGIVWLGIGKQPYLQTFKRSEEEMDKSIVTVLRESHSAVVLDNLGDGIRFGGDAVCAMLTSTHYGARLLGGNTSGRFSTENTFWAGTGNNPGYLSDTPRRTIEIALDAHMERPEARQFDETFIEICTRRRFELLTCLLVILVAYHNEQPKVDLRPIGSFETFSRAIGGPVKWLLDIDIADAMPPATCDEKTALFTELVSQWGSCFAYKELTLHQATDTCHEFRKWVSTHFADRTTPMNLNKMGIFLRKFAGRIVDGRTIRSAGLHNGCNVWRFEIL